MIKLISVIGLCGFLALIGFRIVPAWMEYIGIKRICDDLSVTATSPADLRKAFDTRAGVEYITSLGGGDLVISKDGARWDITFSYEKRIPLGGNVSLVFDFSR